VFAWFRSLRLWQRLALVGVAVSVALAVIGALIPKSQQDLNYKTNLTDFPLQLTGVTVPAGNEILIQCKYVFGQVVPSHEGQ